MFFQTSVTSMIYKIVYFEEGSVLMTRALYIMSSNAT